MREILFRGKKKHNGEWVEGFYNHLSEGEGTHDREQHFIQTEYKGRFGMIWEVDPETVGQYIGLRDKNGKKIFEGDILDQVSWWYGMETRRRLLISYEDTSFAYSICDGSKKLYSTPIDDCESGEDVTTYEIVGNIYDNPELLKERYNV